MEAGVRQGCPLAPLLYLLIAQAVLSWLKSKGIGITVLSELLTAGQHADDLKALLEGPEEVPTFIVAMKIFAMATGQHMLPAKTKLLPIGKVPEVPLPEQIEGLPVVSSAKALGPSLSQPILERQMADALAALPPLKIVASLVPGPWCSNTPIWSNPILLDSTNQPLERGTSALNPLNGRGIASLGDLLKARMELEAISPEQFFRTWKDLTYPGRPNDCPLDSLPHKIFFQHRTIPAVAAILDAAIVEMDQKLPVGWLDAAQYPGTALVSDTEDLILSSMGWTFKNRKILLKGFSVKMGTILQVTQREPPQKAKMEEFAKLVSEDTPLQAVQRMFCAHLAIAL
ncbi:hypothetical protein KSW81_008405 [Nannochloris sp. 'desiccata']|nr:hypothetical protein KSW81_008405 [Chlorella desiccata (nom. nud.)]